MSDYVMPTADLGDWVFYRAHEGAETVPALVTKTSQRTLTLWVLAPGYGGVEKQSVHHAGDPGVNDFPAWKEYGYWEHKPQKNAILAEKVALLERKVADLEARRGK
jgi:hypothetical protein